MNALAPRYQQLKNAVADLVRAIGGQEAAPGFTRLSRHQSFHDYGSVDQPERWMPLDVIADLERNTHGLPGHPHVTRALCINAGGAFVTLPDGGPGSACFHGALADLMKEFGEVTSHLLTALGDGEVCARDVREKRLIAEVNDVLTKGVALRAMLEAVEAGG